MAVWTKSDQVLKRVVTRFSPGSDMGDFRSSCSTGGNGAAVTGFHEDGALNFGRYGVSLHCFLLGVGD